MNAHSIKKFIQIHEAKYDIATTKDQDSAARKFLTDGADNTDKIQNRHRFSLCSSCPRGENLVSNKLMYNDLQRKSMQMNKISANSSIEIHSVPWSKGCIFAPTFESLNIQLFDCEYATHGQ